MTRKADTARTDWKVCVPGRGFVAAFKDVSDAAVMVAHYGNGAQIKYKHHTVVWTEGKEDRPAEANYDHVAYVCVDRVNAIRAELLAESQRQNTHVEQLRRRTEERRRNELVLLGAHELALLKAGK